MRRSPVCPVATPFSRWSRPSSPVRATTSPPRRSGGKKNKWRLRHLVTHSRHREWLLANLMRPAELFVVALSPFLYLRERLRSTVTGRGASPAITDRGRAGEGAAGGRSGPG
jgi:hypothetical protein